MLSWDKEEGQDCKGKMSHLLLVDLCITLLSCHKWVIYINKTDFEKRMIHWHRNVGDDVDFNVVIF